MYLVPISVFKALFKIIKTITYIYTVLFSKNFIK